MYNGAIVTDEIYDFEREWSLTDHEMGTGARTLIENSLITSLLLIFLSLKDLYEKVIYQF